MLVFSRFQKSSCWRKYSITLLLDLICNSALSKSKSSILGEKNDHALPHCNIGALPSKSGKNILRITTIVSVCLRNVVWTIAISAASIGNCKNILRKIFNILSSSLSAKICLIICNSSLVNLVVCIFFSSP